MATINCILNTINKHNQMQSAHTANIIKRFQELSEGVIATIDKTKWRSEHNLYPRSLSLRLFSIGETMYTLWIHCSVNNIDKIDISICGLNYREIKFSNIELRDLNMSFIHQLLTNQLQRDYPHFIEE